MPRFFVNPSDISSGEASVTGEDARHITKVLRMRPGQTITLCDGCGTDYEASIVCCSADTVSAKILSSCTNASEPPVRVTLYQALPKSGKMEYIIQKCTELGIYKIIPCIMERCVVKLKGQSEVKKKTDRYQSVAYAAAKQSQRGIVPLIGEPVVFGDALCSLKDYDLSFIPYEGESTVTVKHIFAAAKNIKTAAFLIGPEGGISSSELDFIKKISVPTVTLGKRILRTETAGETVLSMMNYEFFL